MRKHWKEEDFNSFYFFQLFDFIYSSYHTVNVQSATSTNQYNEIKITTMPYLNNNEENLEKNLLQVTSKHFKQPSTTSAEEFIDIQADTTKIMPINIENYSKREINESTIENKPSTYVYNQSFSLFYSQIHNHVIFRFVDL